MVRYDRLSHNRTRYDLEKREKTGKNQSRQNYINTPVAIVRRTRAECYLYVRRCKTFLRKASDLMKKKSNKIK